MDISFLDFLDTIEDGDLSPAAIVEMEGTFFYLLGKKPEINPTTLMRDRGVWWPHQLTLIRHKNRHDSIPKIYRERRCRISRRTEKIKGTTT